MGRTKINDVWYVAKQKSRGYTRNPDYAVKDAKGNPINEAAVYKANRSSNGKAQGRAGIQVPRNSD